MFAAFTLAINQLSDKRLLILLAKCLVITLLVFVVAGAGGWFLVQGLLDWLAPSLDNSLQQLVATLLVIMALLLLWRIIALAVLQFHADEVVAAVEQRHYPDSLAHIRPIEWREELRDGMAAAVRTVLVNLIALPFALLLLVTGVGAPLLFWAVNAVLLGRELDDMVWRRHRSITKSPSPLQRNERWLLGGIVSVLLIVPFINLLAPFIGAAAATHLHHRKGTLPYAA